MSGQPPYDPSHPALPPGQQAERPDSLPSDLYGTAQPGSPASVPSSAYQVGSGRAPVRESGGEQALTGFLLGMSGLVLFSCSFVHLPISFLRLLLPGLGIPVGSLSFLLSLPISLVGIIFSVRGRRSAQRRKLAAAGLMLSLLTLVLSLFLPLLLAWAAFSGFS